MGDRVEKFPPFAFSNFYCKISNTRSLFGFLPVGEVSLCLQEFYEACLVGFIVRPGSDGSGRFIAQ
jgi:hypothetical protein